MLPLRQVLWQLGPRSWAWDATIDSPHLDHADGAGQEQFLCFHRKGGAKHEQVKHEMFTRDRLETGHQVPGTTGGGSQPLFC